MAAQRALAPALLVSSALWCLVQLPAHRPDPGDWSWRQAAIDSRLQHTPGRHLVVVEDRRGDPSSWALPTPDPFDAQVVWAEEEDLLQWVPQGVAVWRQRLGVDRVWRLVLDREGDHLRPFE